MSAQITALLEQVLKAPDAKRGGWSPLPDLRPAGSPRLRQGWSRPYGGLAFTVSWCPWMGFIWTIVF